MSKFEYTPSHDDDDRFHLIVDDILDINVLRTEEGINVSVYDSGDDEYEPLGSIVARANEAWLAGWHDLPRQTHRA